MVDFRYAKKADMYCMYNRENGNCWTVLWMHHAQHHECAWNTRHLWTRPPVVPRTFQTCIHCLRTKFWTVIACITLIKDVFPENFILSFIYYFPCLHLTASLAPNHSCTINDCYNALYRPCFLVTLVILTKQGGFNLSWMSNVVKLKINGFTACSSILFFGFMIIRLTL